LNDQLYKEEADGGRLFRLTRQQVPASLDPRLFSTARTDQRGNHAATSTARSKKLHHLRELLGVLERQRFTVIGQVPTANNVMDRIRDWLAALPPAIVITLRARGCAIKPDSAGGFQKLPFRACFHRFRLCTFAPLCVQKVADGF